MNVLMMLRIVVNIKFVGLLLFGMRNLVIILVINLMMIV